MRTITKETVDYFLRGKNFKKSNMEVKVVALEKGVPCLIEMYLHGNKIAELHKNERTEKLYISACGWLTNTTKERLNALPGVSIKQKNFDWYLNGKEWDGKLTEIHPLNA